MKKTMHLQYSSAFSLVKEGNSSFDYGVLDIAYHGRNRNGSYISKESFEQNIQTAYNCPIVCHYTREDDSIGGHDVAVHKDENSQLRLINLTEPVGVIPESSNYQWVTKDDGHEYLRMETLLWKRQEAYQKIKEDGIVAESMEINVKSGYQNDEDNTYVIEDFEFTAFCLLGDGIEPCFEQAALETFSLGELKEQIATMMAELKESTNEITPPTQGVDIENNLQEGGNILEEKIELLNKYGKTVEELDFSIEEMSLEELQEKLAEFELPTNEPETNPPEDTEGEEPIEEPPVEEASEDVSAENFELNGNLRAEMESELRKEIIRKPWGDECRYWLEEYDAEKQELYCRDITNWLVYKLPYSMDGDKIIINYEQKARVKLAYVDFNEGEDIPIQNMFSAFEEKYQNYIEPLEEFKRNTEEAAAEAQANAEREEIFSVFDAELSGVSAYEELKSNCAGIAKEALEEKCYAIKGRYGKFSLESKTVKLPIEHSEVDAKDPYGGVVAKYGIA